MPKPGPLCPYCPDHPPSTLRDAGDVYGPKFEGQFNLWVCVNYPECDAYVGIIAGSFNAEPSGTLARKDLRYLRKRLRKFPVKGNLRVRIARQLQINRMDEGQCRRELMALSEMSLVKETH